MAENYDLQAGNPKRIAPPELDYRPPMPRAFQPQIGLIACGGITQHHLKAYRNAGWDVVALYDVAKEKAQKRRDEFYPTAKVCVSVDELLAVPGLNVVDIATHPAVRGPLIERALLAGKHVLSQKPFVLDLQEGQRLVELARRCNRKLAVNQNGRWAPYFAWMRQAVKAGCLGEISTVNMALNWDHSWTAGTDFEKMHHLLLCDFAIHWFDAAYSLLGAAKAQSVFASLVSAPGQPIKPPLVASSVVRFERGLATLSFNGYSLHAPRESVTVVGSKGTVHASGAICAAHQLELATAEGVASLALDGSWFPDGFQGTMGELLCAIESERDPQNSAADNLKSLAICLGAMRSADENRCVAL